MKYEDCGPKIDDDTMSLFEKEINKELPDDYKAFLLNVNGGTPLSEYEELSMMFRWSDAIQDCSNVRYLHGIRDVSVSKTEYCYSLRDNIRVYKNRIPAEVLPIGSTSAGDLICMGVDGEQYGKIYFWNHDHETDEGEEPDYSNMDLVAETFQQFLDNLYPDTDY